MHTIATSVDDSFTRMRDKLEAEKARPHHAMDPYFYRSHLVHEQELEHLVFKSWVYALHASEIPDAGDYQLVEMGEDSIIVARTETGAITAMHNICRHRGARVCEDLKGNRKTYVCPYHGWVYNVDGTLKAARETHVMPNFDASAHGLKPVNCVTYMGLVFINCDPEAGDLLASLENIREPLGAYDLDHAKVAHRKTYRVDANWKLAIENYLECYHCATSHRAYAKMHTLKDLEEKSGPIVKKMLESADNITGIPGISKTHTAIYLDAPSFGACAHTMRYGLFEGFVTGSQDGQPVAPLMGNIKDYDGGAGDFQMGPLTFMLNYPDHCVLYRFLPRSLTETDMELVWFVREDAVEGKDYDVAKLTWLWHHTTLEDEYIITRNAAGVNSRFFEPGPYHPEFEFTLQQFVCWYLHSLEASLP
jgi:phenylpropionate dioxygenase-like ring-hydroxylating dioxygenase large terminal subunit